MWHAMRGDVRSRFGYSSVSALLLGGGVAVALLGAHTSPQALAGTASVMAVHLPPVVQVPAEVLATYCVVCHNQTLNTGGLALDAMDVTEPSANSEVWERVIQKLRTRTMPPSGMPRPDDASYDAVAAWLETDIDRAWAASPNPGRIHAVHRVNRTEYNNAIRDLFALNLDVRGLLPGDETADGSFDNFAELLSVSTSHLERYMTVARQVTRLAVGLPPVPGGQVFEVPLHIEQQEYRMSDDLPLGSRGGIAVRYHFPVDGEYLLKVRLRRQYADYLMGTGWEQDLDVRVDGELVRRFTVGGDAPGRPAPRSFAGGGPSFGDPEWETYMQLTGDASLEIRVPVQAGERVVGVSFIRDLFELEGVPQPIQRGRVLTNDNLHMEHAAVHSVEIRGPFQPAGLAEETASRRQIFVCHPRLGAAEEACATEILSAMSRRAYRRTATDSEVQVLLEFFDQGREEGGTFDTGIQFALERLLVDPNFLIRVYRDPVDVGPEEVYRLSDLELASRLSFFLWSSIPDDRLLDLAERGELTDPVVLEQEVRRMFADPRATDAFVNDFAAQWLNLRRVTEVVVDPLQYPHFDQNLLEGFQRETELFLSSMLREDRGVIELLTADYTYVNQRVARHYGIPGIYGNHFRRVTLPNLEQRGGLLAQGAVLSVSSYPDRTSPVLRGKWLLDNILGAPPPPPPANVDTDLPDQGPTPPSIRERLALHRTEPLCNSCHGIIDPLGFAMERYDVIGGYRSVDESGNPIDDRATMPNGVEVQGLVGARAVLVERGERFVHTVTEKLLQYALGRPLEYYDQPAVRRIVRNAAADDYRWSSIMLGIVESPVFLMRRAPPAAE